MPLELGQALVQVPPLAKAEDPPLPGPSAASQGELSSPEAARQLFRGFQYQVLSGPHETLRQLRKLCFQWLQPEVHSKEQILELLMLEQFLTILPREIQMWVRTQCPRNGEEAVTLVESLKDDPQKLWRWISTQVLGQESSTGKMESTGFQERETDTCPEVEPQALGLQNSASGPGEHLSHIIKEEPDSDPELVMTAPQLLAPPEERLINDQDSGGSLLQASSQEQWRHLDSTQKEHYWNVMLETYGKMVSGGTSSPKPDPANSAEYGEELAGLPLHATEEIPAPTYSGNRQDKSKENLNVETCWDQESPDAPCHISGEAPPQGSLSGFFGENEQRCFGEGDDLPKIEGHLQGEEKGEQLSSQERVSGKQLDQHLPDSHPEDLSVLWLKEKQEAPQKDQLKQATECGKTFHKSQLVLHQRTHTEKMYVQCPSCKKDFLQNPDFARHQRICTGEKPCKCDHCGKGFSNYSGLRHHEKIHSGEQPYKCSFCEKTFSHKSNFGKHQSVHTGEKPYKCPLCEKSFKHRSAFNAHQRVHTGEKPYKCALCEKSFFWRSTFNRHQWIHTGEKPYKCSFCEKSFIDSSTFFRHHRVHTGEKPYKCPLCEKNFIQKSNVIRHQRTHFTEKPFKCSCCGKSFSRSLSFDKHLRSHLGKKSSQ